MRIWLATAQLVTLLATTGCRTFTDPARKHTLAPGVSWLDYDATRRGTLVFQGEAANSTRVLSEPSPDTAMGVVSEFVAKASYQGIEGNASAKVTESIAELGKRTQTIMFLREALFRLNEMQFRNELTNAEIQLLYTKVIDTALELAKVDQLKAAQSLPPDVVNALLSSDAQTLREEFDNLLKTSLKDDAVKPAGVTTMEDYANNLVATDPEFKDETLWGVRSRAGPKLQALIEKLRAVAK